MYYSERKLKNKKLGRSGNEAKSYSMLPVAHFLVPFLGLVWVLHVCTSGQETAKLDAKKTRVFGPGVHPKRSRLPVNYFYIQAVDTEGNKSVYLCNVFSDVK